MKLEEKLAGSPKALVAVQSVLDEASSFAGIESALCSQDSTIKVTENL